MSFLTRTIPTPGHAALPCLFGGRKGSFLSLPRAHQVRDRLREHIPSCRQHSELPSARSLVEHDQKWVVPSPMNSSKDSPLFNTNRFSVLCSVHPSIQQNLLCIGIFLSVPENPQSDWWPDVVLPLLKLLPFPISPPKPTLYPSGLPDSHTTLDTPYTASHLLELPRINPYAAISASTKPGDLGLGSYSSLSQLTLPPRVTKADAVSIQGSWRQESSR